MFSFWNTNSWNECRWIRCPWLHLNPLIISWSAFSVCVLFIDPHLMYYWAKSQAFSATLFLDGAPRGRSVLPYPWCDPAATLRCHLGASALVCVLQWMLWCILLSVLCHTACWSMVVHHSYVPLCHRVVDVSCKVCQLCVMCVDALKGYILSLSYSY